MKNKSYIEVFIIIGCIFVFDQLYVKISRQSTVALVCLFPILITYLMSYVNGKTKNITEFIKNIFVRKEKVVTLVLAMVCIGLYYGICVVLENYDFKDIVYVVLLCYIPWIMLQWDLIELGLNEKG
ncbi:MAG: hypothetical protein LUF02_08030 [Erysipelotrichaceae bacterium]|nr:hypothetical protein [Erysipelotrichaceae bacterium]